MRPTYPGVGDGTRRTTFPRATHPYREEEEEGLFKASAVNEEDPERDRATQV